MNLKPLLVALVVSSVALAGCTDDDAGTDSTDGTGLQEGTGGIMGLLVDDTFRPIHLTDAPNGEYQAAGSILVAPTGDLVQTSENGEFTLDDLPPGTYTLQVSADGYEAAPETIEVEVGAYTEVTIEARRVVNDGGQVITQEYAIFIDCWYANPVFFHTEVNCFVDLSRDSKRGAMRADYTHIDNVTYMVAEFLINEEGNYNTQIGYGEGEAVEETWAETIIEEGDYARLLLSTDEAEVASAKENETGEFDGHLDNTRDWIAVLFPLGEDIPVYDSEMIPQEQVEGFTLPPRPGDYVGAGVATRAQVVTTLFIGEPQFKDGKTLQDYCAICEG